MEGGWGKLDFTSLLLWKFIFLPSALPVQLFQGFSKQQRVPMPVVCATVEVLLLKQTHTPQFCRTSCGVINKDTHKLLLGIWFMSLTLLSSTFCSGSIWKCYIFHSFPWKCRRSERRKELGRIQEMVILMERLKINDMT